MKYLKIQLLLFISILLFSITVQAEVVNISNKRLKQLMEQDVPVIDIRRPDEWKSTGIIPGSHLMTFFDARGKYDLDKWLAKLDKIVGKNDIFILVCRSGNRTGQVSHYLDAKLGYTRVHHLQKGIKNWIRSGDKVVSVK